MWLMRCDTADEAEKSASRIVSTVRTTPVSIASLAMPIALTVTLGLACVGENEDLSSAIKRADVALYQGKNGGETASSLPPDAHAKIFASCTSRSAG